ncbi:hypothetical protein RFI_26743 [Reticulomyxa filosa]|uniref:Uncharacterized protein n=1 Tax=Reticulomyxa filosa TaxID=46433 RepID=X6M9F2_RETFI|nr:hypothetical protein RFI_26743 [Reticulomyxa filosa]|eukprot:ETO10633.1 hypothetical protein RFI_26743 [Reticulomyxa filosa]
MHTQTSFQKRKPEQHVSETFGKFLPPPYTCEDWNLSIILLKMGTLNFFIITIITFKNENRNCRNKSGYETMDNPQTLSCMRPHYHRLFLRALPMRFDSDMGTELTKKEEKYNELVELATQMEIPIEYWYVFYFILFFFKEKVSTRN